MTLLNQTPERTEADLGRSDVDRELVLDRYLALLRASGSPLVSADGQVADLVTAQLYGVFDAVCAVVDIRFGAPPKDRAGEDTPHLSETIGRSRASSNIHPSQSLHAATLIFEAALPAIARRLAAGGDPEPEMTAGVLLNREILSRMAEAARAYVDLLLDKAQNSNRDERRRLSRELHDVAAPSVAIGLQNLELFDLYADADPERATVKLQMARQSLLDALATIRGLSAQSREAVGTNGLAEALRRYLDTLAPPIQRHVTVRGDLEPISLSYAEEVFLIVREAVRNAVDHGAPKSISVELEARPDRLLATVTDDGCGFIVDDPDDPMRGVGIVSMHERAELLGATLTIRSDPGKGTEVRVDVSLPLRDRNEVR